MTIKVSVIIPVYNAEQYIAECIESLLSQTLKECEFIFINDGSTDKSREIIKAFKLHDERIKLINQENQGVSIARNKGLEQALGEYIGFVDADDYIESDMYETLYYSAKDNNCDVVFSNFEGQLDGHKYIIQYPFPTNKVLPKCYVHTEIAKYLIKEDNLNSVWNKLYKLNVVIDNNISFPNKVVIGEDSLFNIQIFSTVSNAMYLDYKGYHYRDVDGSATRDISAKDYYKRALEVYSLKIPENFSLYIDNKQIKELKSIKLIKSVMSFIHLYFTPSNKMGLTMRYKYVKDMINDKYVNNALAYYFEKEYNNSGRFEKVFCKLIKYKFIFGLYILTTYSRYRNKLSRHGGVL
ncbi:glycosyltransferase involved in cell wall biosynthesis [Evansella vedderi]|uniref:Glycosyltransferase involved in cell wall biosynthesis n=1 Tax=Evansella vedderi TaxID=38282 RepID=A0ABT9ZZA9_9BACI|nr:glycosyltransferase [Evansella vedderi]MDQ0256577.1 glycosyltransferase involved in cell wall biosynthesis [Evansella vedderi]